MAERIEEIKEKLIEIVRNEFNLDIADIDPDKDFREQLELDSLQFVELYAAVVEEFNIQVPITVMNVKTFAGILEILDSEIKKVDH